MEIDPEAYELALSQERRALKLTSTFKAAVKANDGYAAGAKKPKAKKKNDSDGDGDFNEGEHDRDENGMFIQTGDSGAEVRAVGAALGSRQLNNTFDEQMAQEVRNYQQDNGLLVDGIVGSQTATALLGKDADKKNPGEITESQKKALIKQMRTSNATKARRAEKK